MTRVFCSSTECMTLRSMNSKIIPSFLAGCFLPVGIAIAQEAPSSPKRLKEFSEGVWINWSAKSVELDAKVVFREGMLELVACSPRTREHESIVAVIGRPRDIYQAMGLLGMEPGTPVRYDEKNNRLIPPAGEKIQIDVRYQEKGKPKTVPITKWLIDNDTNRPPRSITWVFAGSRTNQQGRFTADLEGTVISVVDFDTALISPASLHTADNELLWLSANTKAIPKIGTKCRLIVSRLVGKGKQKQIGNETSRVKTQEKKPAGPQDGGNRAENNGG